MKVWVTRPETSGEILTEMCKKHGIFAIHQPLFKTQAGRELKQLPSILNSLNSGDYVLAVSKNAVQYASDIFNATATKWRDNLKYFAIGQSTANYFTEVSGQAVRFPVKFANSENLLTVSEMKNVYNRNVVILRAESGRELISTELKKRGANVQTIECYQRKPLNFEIDFCKSAEIDTLIVTSCGILEELWAKTPEIDQKWLKNCAIIVVSERIANLAIQFGWEKENITISPQPNNQSLLDTVLSLSLKMSKR